MTTDDVEDIQEALTEMGIMMIGIKEDQPTIWTYHQRKLYERATQVLNLERERLHGNGG